MRSTRVSAHFTERDGLLSILYTHLHRLNPTMKANRRHQCALVAPRTVEHLGFALTLLSTAVAYFRR